MRTLTIAVLCVIGGLAWAAPSDEVKVYTLTVKERIQNLELINVTVEKKVSVEVEALDTELVEILQEIEVLEKVETVEVEED
jgi:hypothetical protein